MKSDLKSKILVVLILILMISVNIAFFKQMSHPEVYNNPLKEDNLKLDAPDITIITPENITYTEPLSGNYLGTYGFDNDVNGANPEDWSVLEDGGTVNVILNHQGHNKVVELYDINASVDVKLYQDFAAGGQEYGTIEFWSCISDTTKRFLLQIFSSTSVGVITVTWDYTDGWTYHNGVGWVQVPNIANPVSDVWFHFTTHFERTTGLYKGLNQNKCEIIKDGVSSGALNLRSNEDPYKISINTRTDMANYYIYVDAVGYSWDPNYNVGDNLNEEAGPMDGNYLGTYGFDNDVNGANPEDWSVLEDGGTVNVISNHQGHNKVVKLHDISAIDDVKLYQDFAAGGQEYGTIEFWGCINDITKRFLLRIFSSTLVGVITVTWDYTDGWTYHNGVGWVQVPNIANPVSDVWFHFTIHFERTTGLYKGLNQNKCEIIKDGLSSGALNLRNNEDPYTISINTRTDMANYYIYVDAVGYSWDPIYNVGDNLNEGILLSFESSIIFDWLGYSLDEQANKTILGNSTFPFPNDGLHTIQVFGNDSMGDNYKSDIRYFFVDVNAPTSSLLFTPYSGINEVIKSTTFTITADDGDGTGVSLIRYKINDSSWITYTGPFTLSGYDYGDYLITYQAIDNVGHIEGENAILVKLIKEPSEPEIHGYILWILIGIISTASIIIINKKIKN